ncbi:unnamed protein product [Aspergillus oryzae RIB40]|uniref:DNA, SC113 n=1 Tax=Aspergillus oryzae (strain ATCC 42149 / RIB 40) TaxID=510516 RepID=Q2U5D8_ASPOR|nr:unnamed protein product [Aspergillus oryzae RIB40]BAE63227.1 unnamed protein product [Aspergillus oryzae RIB40]
MAPAATNVPTTPPRVVGPATKKATRPTNQLPQSMIDEARMVRKEAFDPKVHLNYDPPRRIYTMKEIGNVNISFGDGTTATWNRTTDSEDGTSAVAWHYDSFPFVCVTMLSDCNGMVGGETALRRPDGHIMKVRGPAMGTAMVLQGRYIEHQALKAVGGRERISMVTSFRPRSPIIKDETVLTGVRGISDLSTLYSQYTDYRLELLEERLRLMLKEERRRQIANHPFDLPKVRKFLVEQKEFLDSMLEELIEVHD